MEDLRGAAVLDESEDGGARQQWPGEDGVQGVGDCAEEGSSWSAGGEESDNAVGQDDDCVERKDSSVTAGGLVSEDADDGALFGVSSDGGGSDGGRDSPIEDVRSESGDGDDVNHALDDNDHGGNADRDRLLGDDVGDDHYHNHDRQDRSDAVYGEPHQHHQRRLESTLPPSPPSGEGGINVGTTTSTIRRRKRRDVLSSSEGRGAGVGRSEDGREGQEDDTHGRPPLQGRGDDTPPGTPFNSMSFAGGEASPSSLAAPSEFLRNMPVAGRDREAQAVIEALQEVYRTKLKPIEQRSKFEQFHHDVMTDAELQAKPQVLLLGPYGTGKTTTIRHLIGRDFPSMHISPEPSTDVFQAVMAGTEERTIKGAALCIVDELPFAGLGKFGAPFLSKFQASIVPAPLLDHLTFIDTPGIVAGEKHGARRTYPFAQVVKWFADRSDLILLMFDAHKLDLSEEFREVIEVIAKHGDKVRVVLNKAQEVDSDRLIKVYGALMWTIGRALRGKSDAPKVYVGSFWDGPRRHPDDGPGDDCSFDEDEASLRREMMDLPKNVGLRKINDVMQRAKLVKVHLQIMFAITDRMPRLWGAEAAQERIVDKLEDIFSEVQTVGKIAEADMPDVEDYRRVLGGIDCRDLPRRSRRLLSTMDGIIDREIKQCVTRAGGVCRIYKLDAQAKLGEFLPKSNSGVRRRATMGGGSSLGSRSRGGEDLFSQQGGSVGRRARGPMMVDEMEGWESSNASEGGTRYTRSHVGERDEAGLDESDFVVRGGGGIVGSRTAGAAKEEAPVVVGTVLIVLAMLCAAGVACWKTDSLPPTLAALVASLTPKTQG